jgi:hypothetical protein
VEIDSVELEFEEADLDQLLHDRPAESPSSICGIANEDAHQPCGSGRFVYSADLGMTDHLACLDDREQ